MKLTIQKQSIFLKIIFPLCVLCLMAARPCPAEPADGEKEILAMGASRIYTDILAARSAAVTQCLQTAVEKVVIEMTPTDILTKKFDIITNLIAAQRNPVITNYKVLKEIHTEKNYQVLVQVTVSTAKLKAALGDAGILVSARNLPTILLLITEQQANDLAPHYWWQNKQSFLPSDAAASAMKQLFAKKEFSMIDEAMVPYDLFEDLAPGLPLSDEQAVEMGRRLNADIVVTGSAVTREMANRMGENVLTFQGIVTVRALMTDSGQEIARAQASDTRVSRDSDAGSREALSAAGTRAGANLADQMMAAWYVRILPPGEITLRIAGRDILPYLVLFRNELQTIDGVTGQHTKEMAPDEAVLTVKYGNTAQDLADALMLKTFDAFGINIYEISQNTISIELVVK